HHFVQQMNLYLVYLGWYLCTGVGFGIYINFHIDFLYRCHYRLLISVYLASEVSVPFEDVLEGCLQLQRVKVKLEVLLHLMLIM
ncbi:hypothetical protein ACFLRS_01315, partial [Campylobacterota bacterium]